MSYVHPAWVAHQRQRFMRPDWKRWVKPEARHLFAPPEAKRVGVAESQAEAAALVTELEALRTSQDRARRMLSGVTFELALRRVFQRKYSPDQPRVPAGNPDGGQWTDGEGDGASRLADGNRSVESVGPVLSDESPDPIRPGARYAQTRVIIETSALTGIERIDKTTVALMEKLRELADIVPRGFGPAYGRAVHEAFKAELQLGAVPGVEVGDVESTFGGTGQYGSKGSIRPDIVLRNEVGDTVAIYDVKTGGAEITAPRAEKFRQFTRPSVRVIELHIDDGVSLKYRLVMRRVI